MLRFYKTFPKKGFYMTKNFIVDKYTLDDNQMKLLLNDENTIVIAGAGSGKTLTILGKINYLIEKKNINPDNILLISFTNASVNDVKSRLKYNVNVFTFHKLAIHILKKNKISYSLCKTNLLKYIIKEYIHTCEQNEQKTILKFLDLNISFSKFLKSLQFENFCNLIETLISLYKTNNFNYNNIKKIRFTKIETHILLIIFKIYKIYVHEKKSTKKLDFDDLIIWSTNYASQIKLNYKYIIIDEFQDTSLIRLNLIKVIYNNEKSKIIVVGDDWQSIYKFSGCDLNLFLNFSNHFPNTYTIHLKNTYRNSQELLNIASQFIQTNHNQIKKQLHSSKHNNSPIIFVPYKNKSNSLKKLLDHILKMSKDILILSRNNNDIYKYLDKDIVFENNYIVYRNFKLKFLTVHKSKGLEAEYTIILNCNNTPLGFPNKIENHKIINKLFPNEKMIYAEERRLFYVAITRCKNSTYIMYDNTNPSVFVKEIKRIVKQNLKKITYFK